MKRFEDSPTWQKAQELATLVYFELKGKNEYVFKDQIFRAAISVSNNFSEGYDSFSLKEKRRYISIARGSCNEVRSMAYLGKTTGILSEEKSKEIVNLCEEIGRLLYGFKRSIDARIKNN